MALISIPMMVADEIIILCSNYLARALISKVIYHFRVAKIIKDVENEKEKLILNRDNVGERVKAIKRTQKVNDAVFRWLNDVEKLMEEVENLETEVEKDTGIYLIVFLWAYDGEMRRRRGMYDEMLKKIKTLNVTCEFESFSSPVPGLKYFLSGKIVFLDFESTKEASNKLLEALDNDSSNIIGLYGKRGSGKTTLVKAVGEKAKHLNIFDAVLFATVSQNPNIVGRIQYQIADSLNLKFDKSSEVDRARKISLALQSKGRVLVILDDVKAKLELEDIGIPCNDNRCKVLLTTHRQRECALMKCQWEIPLHCLSKEEAWTMLKKHSGIDDESPSDLLDMAQKVAFECKRLPGTIKDVGSSLKNKPIEEWQASLDSLRHITACYQVFLSFRGKDTRLTFTGSLYRALCREGFKTFMDKDGLKGGEQISLTLIKAIQASRLSIIVFSENFAYSTWCLDELVTILECKKSENQQIWPIFYKVEPSDIRHQINNYGEAMAALEDRFGNDSVKVQRWRSALSEVANLSGMHYRGDGYEYEFIQMIVEKANNIKNRLYIQSMDMD